MTNGPTDLRLAPTTAGYLDAGTVENFVRNRLSRFSIPRDVRFVDELPRTVTGKVLERQLTR